MVATLVRLQLKLISRGLRGSTARRVTTVIMALYLGSMVVALDMAMFFMRGMADLIIPGTILGFAFLMVAWPIASLLISGGGALSDAGRFALFPVTSRQLIPGMLVAGLFGMGAVATIGLLLGYLVAWSFQLLPFLAALVAAILGLFTCILLARTVTAAFSTALQRRRYRETAAIVMFLGILGVSYGIQILSRLMSEGLENGAQFEIAGITSIVGWTPFGWAWSIPAHIYLGEWLLAGAKLVLSLAFILVLARAWAVFLDRDLTSPLEVGGDAQRVKRLNPLDGLLPDTPAGAIARRSLRYWRRDSRRFMQLIAVFIMPLLLFMPLWFGGEGMPAQFVVYTPLFAALMAGSAVAWDISYDGSSLWMQISAGISGRDDRLGRAMAFALIMVPYFFLTWLGVFFWTGLWVLAPGILGAGLVGIGSGIGLGSWVGSVWQTAFPPASGNMFRTSSGGGFETFIGSMITLFVPMILTGAFGAGAALSLLYPWTGWVVLLLGAAVGGLVAWWGIVTGGKKLDQRWPEVLKAVTWQGD